MDNTEVLAEEKAGTGRFPKVDHRSVETAMFLSVLTLGLYDIYWQYLLVKNVKRLKADDSGCVSEMLCLLFVPFYSVYWWYTRGCAVRRALAAEDRKPLSNGLLFLILTLLGLPVVAAAILQCDLNTLPATVRKSNTKELAMLAVLSALVILLQTLSAFGVLKVGLFSITLTLVPIVVGGILLGPAGGSILGLVFGIMVCIYSITGVDPGGLMVFQANPLLGAAVYLLKGVAAGFIPALIYKILPKKFPVLNAFIAAVLAPIANTGIFLAGMLLFFRPLLELWKSLGDYAAESMFLYIILGLCGFNFLIEFVVNAVLSPAIATIVKTAGKVR